MKALGYPKENRYSTIRVAPESAAGKTRSVATFYETLTKPASVTALIVAIFATLHKEGKIVEHLKRLRELQHESILYFLLLILSFIVGIRIVQSLYLAKRDYEHIEHRFSDILVFLVVVFFTCGAVLQTGILPEPGPVTVWIYSACGLFGTCNFLYIYRSRLIKFDPRGDYDIERRIQLVNFVIFLVLTLSLFASGLLLIKNVEQRWIAYVLIGLNFPLTTLNILHSGELSLRPKFLFHNGPDDPEKVIADELKSIRVLDKEEATNVTEMIRSNWPVKFMSLDLTRAYPVDAPLIAKHLVNEFGYVFRYLLKSDDCDVLERFVTRLLRIGGGFGAFGVYNFYFIRETSDPRAPNRVGLAGFSYGSNTLLYRWVQAFGFALKVIPTVSKNPFRWVMIASRTVKLLRLQTSPGNRELHLTYLVVFPDHRRKHVSVNFLRMLKNALRERTNSIEYDYLCLRVRVDNTWARKAFTKCGFTTRNSRFQSMSDPLAQSGATSECEELVVDVRED